MRRSAAQRNEGARQEGAAGEGEAAGKWGGERARAYVRGVGSRSEVTWPRVCVRIDVVYVGVSDSLIGASDSLAG